MNGFFSGKSELDTARDKIKGLKESGGFWGRTCARQQQRIDKLQKENKELKEKLAFKGIALNNIKKQLKAMDEKTPLLEDASIKEKIEFLIWVNDNARL